MVLIAFRVSWPMSIHSLERMPGSRTIISSNCCSLARLAVASGVGWAPTFQMACLMGMEIETR